jgi:hypothetical protein
MIFQFISKLNNVASGILYELHEYDDKYYLVKWNVGKDKFEKKEKKKTIDWWLRKGQIVKR